MEIHSVQPAMLLSFAQIFVVFGRLLGQLMTIRQKLLFSSPRRQVSSVSNLVIVYTHSFGGFTFLPGE